MCLFDVRRIFQAVQRLSRRDLEALLAFVYDAATLERDRPFAPALLARLHELVPAAELVSYAEIDWQRQRILYVANQELDGTDFDPGGDYWQLHQEHPVCERFVRTGQLSATTISDVLPTRKWLERELYAVTFDPFKYEIDFRLPVRAHYTQTFLLHSSRRDFTERDRLVLDLLRPHLQLVDETFAGRAAIADELPLTPREREVLGWVAHGKTNADVAQILWISPGTVRKHLENAYEKLGVRTRTAAVARLRGD